MRKLLLALCVVTPLLAQGRRPAPRPYERHFLTVGGGMGMPRGELKPFLDTSPLLRVGYAYRFVKNFQVETGLDTVFHAANVKEFYQTQVGDLRIKDYQFMLPMGGSVVLPAGRFLAKFGGGGAYLRYQERVRQPFGGSTFRIDCPVCRSRSGWGYFAQAGFSVGIDRAQHFRLGITSRIFRGDTEGDPFGPLPAVKTSDHWINTAAELTFSF